MKICSVADKQCFDKGCAELGFSDSTLMTHAGLAVCETVKQQIGTHGRFVILCGIGSTGGVGLAAARSLLSNGADVKVFVIGDPSRYQGAAKQSFELGRQCGLELKSYKDRQSLRHSLHACSAVIDAIVGSGLNRNVTGKIAEVIEVVNRSSCPVIAVDLPSGVCTDTGQVCAVAVRADTTVAIGLPKRGCLLPPGSSRVGQLLVTHLSVPPMVQNNDSFRVRLAKPNPLPARAAHGHKGTFGDTLVVAGAASYFGAPAFAALACLRAGGGYARLACPQSLVPTIAAFAPEVVFVPQQETKDNTIAPNNLPNLLTLSQTVDFVIVGPGLSVNASTQKLVRQLVEGIERPLLIDGDGITALANDQDLVAARCAPTILTPHPGEMARLLGSTTRQVTSDPIAAALAGAERLNSIVVLKGAGSVVAGPDGYASINTTGNSGMGTAGSGDVLTGTIAAMTGLGLAPRQAVETGVFIHGLAGDLAKQAQGADGMTARDILNCLPAAILDFRKRQEEYTTGTHRVTVL